MRMAAILKPKDVSIRVTDDRADNCDRSDFIDRVQLGLSGRTSAPELIGVKTWKGKETSLAELRGKDVLLEFWGYWCGPCVHSMPILFDLQEKFGDKGLAIIGVHVDNDGEVETADQLDQMCVASKEKLWDGRGFAISGGAN